MSLPDTSASGPAKQSAALRAKAAGARQCATLIADEDAAENLHRYADELEQQADAMDNDFVDFDWQ